MIGMKVPFVFVLYLLGLAGTVEGDCAGNDSRCAGQSESACNTLDNSGADCRWEGSASVYSMDDLEPQPAGYSTSAEEPAPGSEDATTTMPSSEGDCIGNDSRCAGSSKTRCNSLESEGSDCRWRIRTIAVAGSCLGNDSRCADSRQPKCLRLGRRGADCRWEGAQSTDANSGACAGNDSRCSGKTKPSCDALTQEGSDCKWRKDFSVSGELTMQVTNPTAFVNDPNAVIAIEEGIENVTGVPSEYIDLDLYVPERRLGSRALQQSGTVIVTYVITVGSDAPATVAVTGSDIGNVMQASNIAQVSAAISRKVVETFGNNDFNVVVSGVTPISGFTELEPEPESETQTPQLDEDGALLTRCAHPVLVLLSIAFYLS